MYAGALIYKNQRLEQNVRDVYKRPPQPIQSCHNVKYFVVDSERIAPEILLAAIFGKKLCPCTEVRRKGLKKFERRQLNRIMQY